MAAPPGETVEMVGGRPRFFGLYSVPWRLVPQAALGILPCCLATGRTSARLSDSSGKKIITGLSTQGWL